MPTLDIMHRLVLIIGYKPMYVMNTILVANIKPTSTTIPYPLRYKIQLCIVEWSNVDYWNIKGVIYICYHISQQCRRMFNFKHQSLWWMKHAIKIHEECRWKLYSLHEGVHEQCTTYIPITRFLRLAVLYCIAIAYYLQQKSFAVSCLYLYSWKTFMVTSFHHKLS